LIAGTNVATGLAPWSATVDPSGKFLYVTNIGLAAGNASVSAFSINPVSGALTPVGGLLPTGSGAGSMAILPAR
jgi:DNA-binding beta-propeller fold protein YncE